MKLKNTISTLAIALALAFTAQPAAAASCKNVKFNVTNNHFEEREIEIRSIRFRNPHQNGKLQKENVKNKVCRYGATCRTSGDNLKNADKVDLYDIQVVFRHRNNDTTWSKEFITRPFTPKFRKCGKDKQYGPVVVTDSR